MAQPPLPAVWQCAASNSTYGCDRFILLSHNHSPRITFQNRTISQKALSLLPYERSVGFASLRNSGRSTSGIHARPLSNVRCCRPKKFGRLPEGLLPIRTNPSKTALSLSLFVGEELAPPVAPNTAISTTFSKAHQPLRPAPPHLPPLLKGGGLTARHKP